MGRQVTTVYDGQRCAILKSWKQITATKVIFFPPLIFQRRFFIAIYILCMQKSTNFTWCFFVCALLYEIIHKYLVCGGAAYEWCVFHPKLFRNQVCFHLQIATFWLLPFCERLLHFFPAPVQVRLPVQELYKPSV